MKSIRFQINKFFANPVYYYRQYGCVCKDSVYTEKYENGKKILTHDFEQHTVDFLKKQKLF